MIQLQPKEERQPDGSISTTWPSVGVTHGRRIAGRRRSGSRSAPLNDGVALVAVVMMYYDVDAHLASVVL